MPIHGKSFILENAFESTTVSDLPEIIDFF